MKVLHDHFIICGGGIYKLHDLINEPFNGENISICASIWEIVSEE